jgi:hypothetical protein
MRTALKAGIGGLISLVGSAGLIWAAQQGEPTGGEADPQTGASQQGNVGIGVWEYPGAEVTDRSIAGPMSAAMMRCADDVDQVVEFYTSQTGIVAARQFEGGQTAYRTADGQRLAAQDQSDDRPVEMCVLVQHTPVYSATVVISRAEGEKETHVAVTCWER